VMKSLLTATAPSRRRVITVALLVPAGAVGIALALGSRNLAAATALCLLAVVVAAAVAGRASGLLASVISFLGLNFFFTEPHHTFVVKHAADLIALFAFLLSAVIVGALLSRALEERSRAERRATEAQFLSDTTAKLISGDPFSRTLDELARAMIQLFGLARCEISTANGKGAAIADDQGGSDGPSVTVPLATQSAALGSFTAVRPSDAQLFSTSDVELLHTLASQTALAIERAVLGEQVRDARLEVEASQLRAALFSSVTHDLRTPLSSIKASASGLLAEGAHYTEEQREEMVRTVLEEADHLNQIVSNLLDLARMRAGALVPSKQPIFIEDVIGSVLRRMRRALQGIAVRTNIRAELPPIEADPIQIEQVISNLLENAIRFSPGSEIQISAAPWQGVVQVRVADHGPGIPQQDRERVFEEFYRRDAGRGRGGTGLGLAIARAVVLAHGGRIWAEAAPGGGTAIVFEVPAAKVPAEAEEIAPREGVTP
jgi:two-component system sensor histidine kinase KdpD